MIMKSTIIILISVLAGFAAKAQQSNLYEISFEGLDNNQINMLDYKGKKIIIVECDAAKPDRKQLLALDTLYKNDSSRLVVIAIPVSDFGSNPSKAEIKKLWQDTLKLSYVITKISKAKKTNGSAQHKVLRWLTGKDQNNHFDTDVDNDGELFVISEQGRLFACLKEKPDLNGRMMKNILSQYVLDK
jgi:glutathione peroxidase